MFLIHVTFKISKSQGKKKWKWEQETSSPVAFADTFGKTFVHGAMDRKDAQSSDSGP